MWVKTLSIIVAASVALFYLTVGSTTTFHGKEPGYHEVSLYFFWGVGCPHCAKAEPFIEKLAAKYPRLRIKSYEVLKNSKNAAVYDKMAKSVGKEAIGVPAFFIGNVMILGFTEDTGREIEEKVRSCIVQGGCDVPVKPGMPVQQETETVKLPLLGKISASSLSLPVFTIMVAGLDSLNPCAFFVLFFLLSLLLHTHSRKRMVLVGGTFVFFSGLVYFLLMAAWLNMFLLVGNLSMVTFIAGSVALLISLINIKDFFFFRKGISLVIPEEAKPKLFERMRNLLKTGSLPAMLTGTAVLAGAANSYELLCTAGFPMVFTRVLTLRSLSQAEYYLYLVFYNMVYVIPLLVIVLVFVITLGSRKLSVWQGRVLKLLSGLMMLCLALVLLINPALLNSPLISAAVLIVAIIATTLIIYITKRIRPDTAAD
jgi:thiol-disulfide isomerase/thioredoxin